MNAKQSLAFAAVSQKKNILLTGPAGTGKSYTVNKIVGWAQAQGIEVGVTASTGLAAFLVGGRTVHSFLGIGIGSKPAEFMAQQIRFKNKTVYNKLRRLALLVIDEASMIDKDLLEYISTYLSLVRGVDEPFGGLQIILSGDFCQLPPVQGKFCFLADIWETAEFSVHELTELVRQDDDIEFQEILKSLRWGDCTKAVFNKLLALKQTVFPKGILPTRLFPLNTNVDYINQGEYGKVKAKGAAVALYKSVITCKRGQVVPKNAPGDIELCVGAQVLVTANLSETIVNGTRGVVTAVTPTTVRIMLVSGEETEIAYVSIPFDDVSASFMPLKLAYALSIHKSQGMTLDAVEIDIGDDVFEYGQAYVAISRARNMKSVRIVNIVRSAFKCHPAVKKFYTDLTIV